MPKFIDLINHKYGQLFVIQNGNYSKDNCKWASWDE